GEQTLRSGAHQDALQFLARAIQLDKQMHPAPMLVDTMRWARWERQMAEACLSLGNLPDCHDHARQALIALGWVGPSSPISYGWLFMQVSAVQTWHRLAVRHVPGQLDPTQGRIQEAAAIYELLALLYYFLQSQVPAVASALHSLNLAESSGVSPVLARIYGG